MMRPIYLLLLCGAICWETGNAASLEEAARYYTEGDYAKAAGEYEAVQREQGSSSTLCYNLGNAYFKAGEYAPAILNYERALKLNPGNEDARFNLEIAKSRIVDKVDAVEPFFLNRWIEALRNQLTSNGWAVTGLSCFLLFIGSLVFYFFTRSVALKKIGFFGGLLFVGITIISNIFASQLKTRLESRDTAVVFAPTVTIKSSPSESGTDLFILHEGTKVYIQSRLGGWSEIRLDDGNRGWISDDKIEII